MHYNAPGSAAVHANMHVCCSVEPAVAMVPLLQTCGVDTTVPTANRCPTGFKCVSNVNPDLPDLGNCVPV